MNHIAKASRNQTDTQFNATLDPPAVQPQENRVAGDQKTVLITRKGARFIVKPAVGSVSQEKVLHQKQAPACLSSAKGGP